MLSINDLNLFLESKNYIIENVVETLRGKNVATTNVLEGLKVVEIIEKIYKLRDNKK
mgnify:CR=1 FL=1